MNGTPAAFSPPGVIGTTARWLLPQLLTQVERMHPGVRDTVHEGNTTALHLALLRPLVAEVEAAFHGLRPVTRVGSMAGAMVREMGRGPRAQTSGQPSNWPWQMTPHSGQAHARSPALIGWPQPSTMPVSMSSAEAKPDSIMRIADSRYGISSALTTKPARSCEWMVVLPSVSSSKMLKKSSSSIVSDRSSTVIVDPSTSVSAASPRCSSTF